MRIEIARLRQVLMKLRMLQEVSCPKWEIETLWKPRVYSRLHSDYTFPTPKNGDDSIKHCLGDANKFASKHGVRVRLDEANKIYIFKKTSVPSNVSWHSDYSEK
jgi:hypothetical protein